MKQGCRAYSRLKSPGVWRSSNATRFGPTSPCFVLLNISTTSSTVGAVTIAEIALPNILATLALKFLTRTDVGGAYVPWPTFLKERFLAHIQGNIASERVEPRLTRLFVTAGCYCKYITWPYKLGLNLNGTSRRDEVDELPQEHHGYLFDLDGTEVRNSENLGEKYTVDCYECGKYSKVIMIAGMN
jgi:hypothetical protein